MGDTIIQAGTEDEVEALPGYTEAVVAIKGVSLAGISKIWDACNEDS